MARLLSTRPAILTALAVAVMAAPTSLPSSASAEPARSWTWPLEPVPRVVRAFQPPSSPYGPGHRGVDLSGAVGQGVLAVADGMVAFAGSVAGRGVVVVDHGMLSSTYQPVSAYVSQGARVSVGQPLGALELTGSHCLPDACLHLGVKRGDTYLDPLDLLPSRPVRLKPLGGLRVAGETIQGWQWGQIGQWPRGAPAAGLQGWRGFSYGGARGATAGLSAAGGRGPPRDLAVPPSGAGVGLQVGAA